MHLKYRGGGGVAGPGADIASMEEWDEAAEGGELRDRKISISITWKQLFFILSAS